MNDCQCLRLQRRRSRRRPCPLQRSLATAARERAPTPSRLLPPTATSNKNHPPTAALLDSGRRRTMAFDPHAIVGRVKGLALNAWPPGIPSNPHSLIVPLLLPLPNRLARRT